MPIDCQRSTSGGKGNAGMFYERNSRICAAGIPSSQPDDSVAKALKQYKLIDEVDSLIGDAIVPERDPKPLPPLRHPIPLDKRYGGTFSDMAALINPPTKTKFQCIINDIKNTAYSSYWTAPLGAVKDPVPMFPVGYDIKGTTYGKKLPVALSLYDTVFPKDPGPDKTPLSHRAGVQARRNYCAPPFDPDLTYGERSFVDKRGKYAKCCITDDRIVQGTSGGTIINFIQSDFQDRTQPRMGTVLAPNNNLEVVPPGYTFGKLHPPDNLYECLTRCEINPGLNEFRKCLAHLNSLRKVLSTRYLPTFFNMFYLNLKYFDCAKTGWLPKQIVYDYCASKFIRFDPKLIEPLLNMWQAFDGNNIEYKSFVRILNYRIPSPDIPKVLDFKPDCLDYRTTYTEMVKPGQKEDTRLRAGLPSGRYLDRDYPVVPENCCKAINICLPQESDMKSCIAPSIFTLLNVNHRDLYGKREPEVVRRVFEAAGEEFTDEKFQEIWEKAKKYHSQGWVCYETFRRALENIDDVNEDRPKEDHQ